MRARLFLAGLFWAFAGQVAGADFVEGLRLSADDERTRVVLDLSNPVDYTVFSLTEPDRVVIDLPAQLRAGESLAVRNPPALLRNIRSARKDAETLRIVLDVSRAVSARSFLQGPTGGRGHRLVIDLHALDSASNMAPVKTAASVEERGRDVVVVIDPGHGGKDPGARGPRGTREKDVVLAISRRLAKKINAAQGMRAVLVRDRDVYPSLHDRRDRARASKADLFVSIHADAFRDGRARGSSVFVLSERGASSEAARWLAEKENQALLGGVQLDEQDDVVASVLLDLSQDWTLSNSQIAAEMVLAEMGKVNRLHSRKVKRAGFLVLKSPDVPSIFVEAAFISNPDEERKLGQARHQERMAAAIFKGIHNYFSEHAPQDTRIAQLSRQQRATLTHVIARGDTLSEIAETYRVSLDTLRSLNKLRGDRLRVGQKIQIPVTTGG